MLTRETFVITVCIVCNPTSSSLPRLLLLNLLTPLNLLMLLTQLSTIRCFWTMFNCVEGRLWLVGGLFFSATISFHLAVDLDKKSKPQEVVQVVVHFHTKCSISGPSFEARHGHRPCPHNCHPDIRWWKV